MDHAAIQAYAAVNVKPNVLLNADAIMLDKTQPPQQTQSQQQQQQYFHISSVFCTIKILFGIKEKSDYFIDFNVDMNQIKTVE